MYQQTVCKSVLVESCLAHDSGSPMSMTEAIYWIKSSILEESTIFEELHRQTQRFCPYGGYLKQWLLMQLKI
ncbi:hypothetical protein SUGI_0426400 [Cryptomeria japonica]|nr:hypothetical protein SUGI_0426400 [Cryptomeria japonica]